MKPSLKDLATIQMGYSFRTRLEASEEGAIAVIQMKDLLDDNTIRCDGLDKTDIDNIKEHHLVQKGDLVFRSRGLLATSAILVDEPDNAVVAAPLLRIRVTQIDKLLPEYLNWYISQRNAQIFFTKRADGTIQKMISKQTIEELEITLPRLDKQKKIVELAALNAKEQMLNRTLAAKRAQYISARLMQYAEEI